MDFQAEQGLGWGFQMKEQIATGGDNIKTSAHNIQQKSAGEVEGASWSSQ